LSSIAAESGFSLTFALILSLGVDMSCVVVQSFSPQP
jgi:hypothetical protein